MELNNTDMKDRETHHYLKNFHEELGKATDYLLDRIENDSIPNGLKHYEIPVRCKNRFVRLCYSVDTQEFYLLGFDSSGEVKHIMLGVRSLLFPST